MDNNQSKIDIGLGHSTITVAMMGGVTASFPAAETGIWKHISINYDADNVVFSVYADGTLIKSEAAGSPVFNWSYGGVNDYVLINGGLEGLAVDEFIIRTGEDSIRTGEFAPPTVAFGSVVPPPRITASSLTVDQVETAVDLATTALQTNTVGTAAFASTNDFATAAQGAKADAALPKDGTAPMMGDIDMDGYDIDDVGVVNADKIKMIPTSVNPSFTIEEFPLFLSVDAKCGYNGVGDYIGAAGGSGFYAVESASTNKFDLTYLSTNNYIMIQSPLIATTSNLVEKITGYGLCTSDNDPVAGLSVGDHYVTFAHSGTISRTNLVTYSRFGSKLATLVPSSNYCFISINLHTVGWIAIGGLTRDEQINILVQWSADLTTPTKTEIKSYLQADYPIANFVDVRNYKNNIVLFGLYNSNPLDSRRIEPRYFGISAKTISRGVALTN